jgi:hypothetical protein
MELRWLTDEKLGWERVQKLRADFSPRLFEGVGKMNSSRAVMTSGIEVVKKVLAGLVANGLDLYAAEPGHAVGHWVRDYVHAMKLCSDLYVELAHTFVGFLGGTLHDIGCAIVPRYQDSKRVVRHAEAGALLLLDLFEKDACGLNEAEQILVAYAVAAHTHYLKPATVVCADGETRVIEPYKDLDDNGKPIFGVWIARWVDRLDTNGPAFVGRHFLTLVDTHEDFAGAAGFQTIEFAPHMRPLLRDKPDGPQTMAEHLRMFADSQATKPPYGLHDFGVMAETRDQYKGQLREIIAATQDGWEGIEDICNVSGFLSQQNTILRAWTLFLATNVEPSLKGLRVATRLSQMFEKLDAPSREAWLRGFVVCMRKYCRWAGEMEGDMSDWDRRFHGWAVISGIDAPVDELLQVSGALSGMLDFFD